MTGINFRGFTTAAIENHARAHAEPVTSGLTAHVKAGIMDKRGYYLEEIKHPPPINALRLIRSDPVAAQFGGIYALCFRGDLTLPVLLMCLALWASMSEPQMLLRLYRQATRDPLTGLFNRRALMEHVQLEVERARRSGARTRGSDVAISAPRAVAVIRDPGRAVRACGGRWRMIYT